MNSNILDRKGARKADDIPAKVLDLLNQGKIQTVNLTEWLAIDHLTLIKTIFPDLGITKDKLDIICNEVESQTKQSTMNTTKLVGRVLYREYATNKEFKQITKSMSSHVSDSIRCYAPYLISLNSDISIREKLAQSQQLISDKHFGVREVVWMALRPEIEEHLEESIKILSEWTSHEDENIRRFTTEATRPRGVWCKHIDRLKQSPDLALPILENLKSDNSKYVQDSVGNWLNDASKSQPGFVLQLCNKWEAESSTKETLKIIKRAKRTLEKSK
jgi:3-methyladenine DNA glycosylase AlkC